MPPHSFQERIEKELEKINVKLDTIMTNCIPTLQNKVARHDGILYVLVAIMLVVLGLLVKLVWG